MNAHHVTRPAYALTAARTAESGGRWWAEIEVNGRAFAATGATLREVAERLRAKVVDATPFVDVGLAS